MRRLHIGGKVRSDGWEVLNAVAAPYVDHVGNANDLSRFDDDTFMIVYASHVLEHLDYATDLMPALQEWLRVLKPGGRACVSVPDIDVLAAFLLDKASFSDEQRFEIMRMMFGGHVDRYDYHLTGFNEEILGAFLHHAGFVNLARVEGFGFFEDTSSAAINGKLISLNVVAEKPLHGGTAQ